MRLIFAITQDRENILPWTFIPGKFVHAKNTQTTVVVSLCICFTVYLYVYNLGFLEVAKNQALANAVQAQHDNISNLIVLE